MCEEVKEYAKLAEYYGRSKDEASRKLHSYFNGIVSGNQEYSGFNLGEVMNEYGRLVTRFNVTHSKMEKSEIKGRYLSLSKRMMIFGKELPDVFN